MLTITEIDDLVSLERGEVDRRIYSDPAIFELEMERIFARSWLFLCHESQIPEPGDFFQSVMGRDNVLVVRQKDGSIKAMLNTCAHRGNAVCRAEEGNAKNFLCTYHGWSYGIDGRLNGVPGLNTFYSGQLDKSRHGLAPVAQVADYKGFIFGTHDASAPPLEDFLGTTGRLGLDTIALRGEMEVVPGIQKFVIECNWKIAVDNLFDWYHPQITHASAFQPNVLPSVERRKNGVEKIDMTGVNMQSGAGLELPVGGIIGSKFEQVVVLGEFGHAIGGPPPRHPPISSLRPNGATRPKPRRGLAQSAAKSQGIRTSFPRPGQPVRFLKSRCEYHAIPVIRRSGGLRSSTATCRARRATSWCRWPAAFSVRQGYSNRTMARTGRRRPLRRGALRAGG